MNADRIAASYCWLEYAAFGRALEHSRFDFLSHAAGARRVLILGEGDGRFLARFLQSNLCATVAVVEASGRMIQLARERVPPAARSRVKFYQIDVVKDALPDGPFDLAVSHFFLDILNHRDAKAAVLKASTLLPAGALWLMSEFQEPSHGVRRLHARLWLAAMYRFFRWTASLRVSRLPPYREMLERSGFVEILQRESRFGLIRSAVWQKQ